MMTTLVMALALTGQVPSKPAPAVEAKIAAERKAATEAERARLIERRQAKRAKSTWARSAWMEREARLHPEAFRAWNGFRSEAHARQVLAIVHIEHPHDGDGVTRKVK